MYTIVGDHSKGSMKWAVIMCFHEGARQMYVKSVGGFEHKEDCLPFQAHSNRDGDKQYLFMFKGRHGHSNHKCLLGYAIKNQFGTSNYDCEDFEMKILDPTEKILSSMRDPIKFTIEKELRQAT